MHILNVNSYLDPQTGGGTAERTFQMSRFLARHGVQCTVLALDIGVDEARKSAVAPARVVTLACIFKRFFVPYPDWRTILGLVKQADVVHLMGHWSILNAYVYLALRFTGKPYVVCPAGALPVFGRSSLLKHLYNLLIGTAIVRNAWAWIAVTAAERAHFPAYGVPAGSVEVVPNGVSSEDFPAARGGSSSLKRCQIPGTALILFMGRLNPIKGPDLLLEAFIRVADRLLEFHLVFAGPDGGMLESLSRRVAEAGLAERVHFVGYLAGEDKACAYRLARLLVVPSRQEAMSIVALEAGICGTPVLLTDQCGFSEVRTIDLRLEVPATAEGIADGLEKILSDPSALQQIAPIWKEFVERHYSWQAIGPRFVKLYSEILTRRAAA